MSNENIGRPILRAVSGTQASPLETLVKESIQEVTPVAENLINEVNDVEKNMEKLDKDSALYKETEKSIAEVKANHDDLFPEESIEEVVSIEGNDESGIVINEPESYDTAPFVFAEGGKPEEVEPIPVEIEEAPEVIDDPNTPLIETGWRKPNPSYKNGKLLLFSKADGKQHEFEASTEEEAKALAYAELGLFYDVSNLVL